MTGSLRILAIEDNGVEQNLLRAHIAIIGGADIDIVDSAEEALARLEEGNQYDLILSDIVMRGLSGLEMARWLKSTPSIEAAAPPPVVAVTACAMRGDREKILASGMDDYLAKPYRNGELRAVIERNLPQIAPAPAKAVA